MFKTNIISLRGKTREVDLISLVLPTSDGNRTMLPHHMEAYIEIVPGVARLRTENKSFEYFVSDGVFHFKDNQGMIIVGAFEEKNDLDFDRARKAYEKAQRILAESKNNDELRKAEQALKRALGRLKLE